VDVRLSVTFFDGFAVTFFSIGIMNRQRHFKMAKNGLQLMSLIIPTILELEKSLINKFFVQPLS